MDGVSPKVCDQSAITFQALNRSHGPAVLGLRAQMDRQIYRENMQKAMFNYSTNLSILEAAVEDLVISDTSTGKSIDGCVLDDGTIISSDTVLITTGTFLGATIFRGLESTPAGRLGEPASYGLSKTFATHGFELGRLRTGTPPRLNADTIDFSKFTMAPPDKKPIPFSYMTKKVWIDVEKQVRLFILSLLDLSLIGLG